MDHFPIDISEFQRKNLRTLSEFLFSLPADYKEFSMDKFATLDGENLDLDESVGVCGTVCCAAGHGPTAGIHTLGNEAWTEYCDRVFGTDTAHNLLSGGMIFNWCFAERWLGIDNTPHGAAARIAYMLEHGIPENYLEQRGGDAPLCYVVQS